MTPDELTERLEPSGSGYACPVHGDDGYVLAVDEGDDGKILIYCRGGCDTAEILEKLGLRWRDLR